jgi:hypothetical protein
MVNGERKTLPRLRVTGYHSDTTIRLEGFKLYPHERKAW